MSEWIYLIIIHFVLQSVQWGRTHENTAILNYEKMTNKSVTKCGLFVSNSGMLAGSPDGSVYECGELLLLEIKCPWKHRNNSVRHAALSDKQFPRYHGVY